MGRSLSSQDVNAAEVVGSTSSEGFIVLSFAEVKM